MTCENKRSHAKVTINLKIPINGNYLSDKQNININVRPHVFYIVLADCDLNNKPSRVTID